ncbi:MAG: polysaccharide biosynthesis/export family protein [Paracoccaceae bacterium]
MHRFLRWFAFVCLCSALSACSLPRGSAVQNEIIKAQDDGSASFQVVPVGRENVQTLAQWPATGWAGSYRWFDASRGPSSPLIRSGDKIVLTIWDSQETSLITTPDQRSVTMPTMQVSPSGTLFVPYLDEVIVTGLTPSDARRKIQGELEGIVPSAQVQLSHEAGRKNTVDAVRGFAKPGSYPLPDRDYSILTLISQAGGISDALRNPLVRVIRNGETYEIRATNLLEDAKRNVLLRGGDKVVVDEDDRTFIALGATGTEELVYFDQEKVTALEALALVGGLSDSRADLKGVLILREYNASAVRDDVSGPNKSQVVFSFDLTSADGLFAAKKFRVNPDDLLIASESPVTSARTIFGLIGSVVGVGNALDNN